MSSVRTHIRTVKGFCLCHLLCVWQVTGKLCHYLGYYNASYMPQQQRFMLDEQLYVQLMAIFNGIMAVLYHCLSQLWIYDQSLLLLYVPLYVYFLMLRQHFTSLLNDIAHIHKQLERILGTWLCVSLRWSAVLALLLPLELLLLVVCQFRTYFTYQFCMIAGIAFIYHVQLIFLGNYLIWLGSIYRAFSEFLQQHMASSRLVMLKAIVQHEQSRRRLHHRVIRYFSLHFLTFLGWIMQQMFQVFVMGISGDQMTVDKLQLMRLILHLLLLFTILLTAHYLQLQRGKFYQNYLLLEDRLEYFQLKSWGLIKNQALPMPFGLSLPRAAQPKMDAISILYTCNLPGPMLSQRVLPLACLCPMWQHHLHLPLPQLLSGLIKVFAMLLLPLLWRHISFYNGYDRSNFDRNVTHAISQVYRYYQYDEME